MKVKAASDPELLNRLSSAASIQDFLAIAAEVGVVLDVKELETEELSLDKLSTASGSVRMMMASKMGLSLPRNCCRTGGYRVPACQRDRVWAFRARDCGCQDMLAAARGVEMTNP